MSARADTKRPTWKAGDYWEYEGNLQVLPVRNGEAKVRLEVTGTETLTVGPRSNDAYHLAMAINTSAGGTPFDVPGEVWYRTSDLALLKSRISLPLDFDGETRLLNVTATVIDPVAIHWPLAAGAVWSVSGALTVTFEFMGHESAEDRTITGTVEVGAPETVDVAADVFETNPVTLTLSDGNRTRSYWSSEAGNSVREETFDSSGAKTGSSHLTSYRYTAPFGAGGEGLTLLGFSGYLWIVIVGMVAAAVGSALAVRRRRKASFGPMSASSLMPVAPPGPPSEPGPPADPPIDPH